MNFIKINFLVENMLKLATCENISKMGAIVEQLQYAICHFQILIKF